MSFKHFVVVHCSSKSSKETINQLSKFLSVNQTTQFLKSVFFKFELGNPSLFFFRKNLIRFAFLNFEINY